MADGYHALQFGSARDGQDVGGVGCGVVASAGCGGLALAASVEEKDAMAALKVLHLVHPVLVTRAPAVHEHERWLAGVLANDLVEDAGPVGALERGHVL